MNKNELLKKAEEFGIPILRKDQAKDLWPIESCSNNVYFDEKKFEEACVSKIKNDTSPCIMYIDSLDLFSQQKIRGWTFFGRGYTFLHSSIWDNQYFKPELETVPEGGYYLFYDMDGFLPNKEKELELNLKDFYPAPLAVASQAIINLNHFFDKNEFEFAYHVAKYGEDDELGLAVGNFSLDSLKVIFFKKDERFVKKKFLFI